MNAADERDYAEEAANQREFFRPETWTTYDEDLDEPYFGDDRAGTDLREQRDVQAPIPPRS